MYVVMLFCKTSRDQRIYVPREYLIRHLTLFCEQVFVDSRGVFLSFPFHEWKMCGVGGVVCCITEVCSTTEGVSGVLC